MTNETEQKYLGILQKASDKIKALLAENELLRARDPIAVVGMACRFPGANDIESFWELLISGDDAIRHVPSDRWEIDSFYDSDVNALGKSYTSQGGFLDDVGLFDANFFGLTPREAEALDPQQRLLLEVSWEAWENAGIPLTRIRGSQTGVFLGLDSWDYSNQHINSGDPTSIDEYAAVGVSHSTAAGRLSYFYDIKGPSLAVDTACSSSLVSLHMAIASLRRGECDMALAGGVDLILAPERMVAFSKLRALARDGRCRAFDDGASGFGMGEGCGLLVLKPLKDAERDGERILAIIRGSAINQDGESNGLTAPNALSQRDVIRSALEDAGCVSCDIDYIEAHGTGTRLGDPIEARALGMVFAGHPSKLLIGSVKSNIGHLQAAAGIAGVIKVVLCLYNERIPPSLHYEKPNTEIPWSQLPIAVCDGIVPWLRGHRDRRAGVSSFAFNGTNAHVVLQEAPVISTDTERFQADTEPCSLANETVMLLPLSGRTPVALSRRARDLVTYLQRPYLPDLSDICRTAQVGRTHLQYRAAIVGRTIDQLIEKLERVARCDTNEYIKPRVTNQEIVFMFPGQGTQYQGMGRELYARWPVFRREIDKMHAIAASEGIDLHELLFTDVASVINETRNAQPALFALSYALSVLWRSWGIEPTLVLGHSVGELVAASVSGLFSVKDGLLLAATRGRLMQTIDREGGMAALAMSQSQVKNMLSPYSGRLEIAANNAPTNTVISGDLAALDAFLAGLRDSNILARKLSVSHAFHSHHMEPILDEFSRFVPGPIGKTLAIPLISSTTGDVVTHAQVADRAYWVEQLRKPVQFAQAITTAVSTGHRVVLEIGPHAVLTPLGQQAAADYRNVSWVPSMIRGQDSSATMMAAAGILYEAGMEFDWKQFAEHERPVINLPTYPFERVRYWKYPQLRNQNNRINRSSTIMEGSDPNTYDATENSIEHRSNEEHGLRGDFIAEIVSMLGDIAGISDVDIDTNFFRLGLSSIMLTRLRQKVKSSWNVVVPMRDFYTEVNTVTRLAEHIIEQLPASFAQSLPTSTPDLHPAEPQIHKSNDAPSVSTQKHEIQKIIHKQLDIMNQQLELLRGTAQGPKRTPETSERPGALVERSIATPNPTTPERGTRGITSTKAYHQEDPDARTIKLSLDELDDRQRTYLTSFVARYCIRTQKSKEYMSRNRNVFSDWINSLGFRASLKELIYPVVSNRSEGSRLWDIDGNEYIDLCTGYGVNFLGNRPSFISSAILEQLENGFHLGPQFEPTADVARLITRLTGVERVTFTNTGTEAVMTALRIARTVTGREKIVIFENSYHGTFDGILAIATEQGTRPAAPGTTHQMVADVTVLRYGDPTSLRLIASMGNELAAVLVEPVQSRNPKLQPKEFLHELRTITTQHGIVLLFDEIITGFRLCPGGAQEFYDVRADMVCYGKIVGGGMPIGVVAGTAEYMDSIDGGEWSYGDESFPSNIVTFFGGTFCKHPLAMVASRAILERIEQAGPTLQSDVNQKTEYLAEEINSYCLEHGVPIRVHHCGSFFRFRSHGKYNPTLQAVTMDLLFYTLMYKGIYTWERRICFLSTVHTDEDVAAIISAFKDTVAELATAGFPIMTGSVSALLGGPVSFEVSAEQRRLYILSQFEGGEAAYHLPRVIELEGELDIKRLEDCLAKLIQRHSSLRTALTLNGDVLVQTVYPSVDFRLPCQKLEGRTVDTLMATFMRPFDLGVAPLIRIELYRESSNRHILLFDLHHAVGDGISADVFAGELGQLYAGGKILPLDITYQDYIRAQNSYLRSSEYKRDEAYWSRQFNGEIPVLELPYDNPRPSRQVFSGDSVYTQVNEDLTRSLRQMAMSKDTTLFTVLLAAYYVLLGKLTRTTDIVVGIPVSNREDERFNHVIGMFVNTLPLRCRCDRTSIFSEVLASVKAAFIEALEYKKMPFDSIVTSVQNERYPDRNPLFDTMFAFESVDERDIDLDGVHVQQLPAHPRASMVDMTLSATEGVGSIELRLEYALSLFLPETARRFSNYYLRILSAIASNPEKSIHDIGILDADELEFLLYKCNPTGVTFPQDDTLADQFEVQVAATPDNIAVVFADNSLSYRALNTRANAIAFALQERLPLLPDAVVAVMMERSLDMVAVLLGIIKAGAAYLPIDTRYPEDRRGFMLTDSACHAVVCDDENETRLQEHGVPLINVREFANTLHDNPKRRTRSHHLAYILYTSGSTGQPKGCQVMHRSVVRLLKNDRPVCMFGADDVWLMTHSYAFDFSVWEMFGALLFGGRLVIPTNECVQDFKQFHNLVCQQRVTILNQTPGAFYNFIAQERECELARLDEHLRWVILGGDRLEVAYLAPWFERYPSDVIRLCNMYGITETTVHVTAYHLSEEDLSSPAASPIGRPLPATTMYLLDEHGHPVPLGVPGEIYVGGDGVCRGYLNRPELTDERFVENPFIPNTTMYKTGDLARRDRHGEVYYLGRSDFQVQLRGYRVELGEIERALLALPDIAQAIVTAPRSARGHLELVAYLVLCPPVGGCAAPSESTIREHLGRRVPNYMIPAFFVVMSALPLNDNGKFDRSKLPDPRTETHDVLAQSTLYQEPTSEVQRILVDIWRSVLGRTQVGVNENFFELGGDSIKAIQIVARLNDKGQHAEVRDLFRHQTIAEFATTLKQTIPVGPQVPVVGGVPLTPIQIRFFEQLATMSTSLVEPCPFTQSVLLNTRDKIDEYQLRSSLAALCVQHDALRMVYYRTDSGTIVQDTALKAQPVVLEVLDLGDEVWKKEQVIQQVESMSRVIDLRTGPLIRTALVRSEHGDTVLIVIHHLCVDGVSWRILLEDLETSYAQLTAGHEPLLPAKTASFQQWSHSIQERASQESLVEERAYWQSIVTSERCRIPRDQEPSSRVFSDTDLVTVTVPEDLSKALMTEANRRYQTTTQELLLTALGRSLRLWHGGSKTLICMEGHGRENIVDSGNLLQVSRTVGWFTCLYPWLLDIGETRAYRDEIHSVVSSLRNIPDNGVGYGILRHVATCDRSVSVLVEDGPRLLFNYLGRFHSASESRFFYLSSVTLPGMAPSKLPFEFDIEFDIGILNDSMFLRAQYNRNAFERDSVETFLDRFCEQLRTIANHCLDGVSDTRVASISDERERMAVHLGMESVHIGDVYPLSSMQAGMLIQATESEYAGDLAAYHEQFSFDVTGELDVAAFHSAWNQLIVRHEILRTAFLTTGAKRPVQVVLQTRKVPFMVEDISSMTEEEQQRELADARNTDRTKAFDLERDPLIRFYIFKIQKEKNHVLWSFHHIVLDGWSVGVLVHELFSLYRNNLDEKAVSLPPPLRYRALIDWQSIRDQQASRRHWISYLHGYMPVSTLNTHSISDSGFALASVYRRLDPAVASSLEEMARRNRSTVSTVARCLWACALSIVRSTDDVLFGVVNAGRPSSLPGVETIVGLFINTIPFRVTLNRDQTFEELIALVQADFLDNEPFSHDSLADIQNWVHCDGALIDNALVFENYPLHDQLEALAESVGLSVSMQEELEQTTFDLLVDFYPRDKLEFKISYNRHVHSDADATRLADLLEQLSAAVVIHPTNSLRRLRASISEDLVDYQDRQKRFLRDTMDISEEF